MPGIAGRPAWSLTLAAVLAVLVPAMPVAAAPGPAPVRVAAAPAATTSPFAVTLADPIAPGAARAHGTWRTTDGTQVVEVLDVDPAAAGLHVETGRPGGGVAAIETVRAQAARVSRDGHRVVAAINGDVYNADAASGTRAPLGIQVRGGELLTGSPVAHPTLGLTATGAARIDDVGVLTTLLLPDGAATLLVDRVNKPRRAGDLVLYSRHWGSSTHAVAGGVEVLLTGPGLRVRPAGTLTATVAAIGVSTGNAAIPTGSLVLSADGTDEAALRALRVGMTVTLTTAITPGWEDTREAIGGREWLLDGGAVDIRPVSSVTANVHPRTAVGVRSDGHLVMVTVDGREPGYSIGTTAADLAELLATRGAVEAIMLDGGGSTTALARRPGDVEAALLNRPSDGRERAVANALFVVQDTPTGALAGIIVKPGAFTAVVGQTVQLAAKGVDAALNGVPVAATRVAWASDGAAGTVGADGRFQARRPGTSAVSATVAGLTTTATAGVVADTFSPSATRPSVVLATGSSVSPTSVPLVARWTAATDVGTGVARYELQRRLIGGAWDGVALPSPGTRSIIVRIPPVTAVQYRVRAVDRAGNAGAWTTTGVFQVRLVSEAASPVTFAGSWVRRSSSTFLGGWVRATRASGATATLRFTGSQVGWIAPRGPDRGSARLAVDGTAVGTASLHSSAAQVRRLAWVRTLAAGSHRLTVRNLATAGHPRIDVDGFAVVDAASATPVLLGAADIATCGSSADTATAALVDTIPGTVFAAGDLAYPAGSAAAFADCYGPSWGRFAARTRPVPGDEEYLTAGAAPYYATFGTRAGAAGQGWYAYDLGTWRIYGLNSACAEAGGCGPGSPQADWLAADLAANPRACVAAVWHESLFSSGASGGSPATRDLWQVLQDAGADLVITGGDHDYERFAPQAADGSASASGMREFVVGTGGAPLTGFGPIRANSEARQAATHGVLRLELGATGYAWRFLAAGGGTWTDAGSAACH